MLLHFFHSSYHISTSRVTSRRFFYPILLFLLRVLGKWEQCAFIANVRHIIYILYPGYALATQKNREYFTVWRADDMACMHSLIPLHSHHHHLLRTLLAFHLAFFFFGVLMKISESIMIRNLELTGDGWMEGFLKIFPIFPLGFLFPEWERLLIWKKRSSRMPAATITLILLPPLLWLPPSSSSSPSSLHYVLSFSSPFVVSERKTFFCSSCDLVVQFLQW